MQSYLRLPAPLTSKFCNAETPGLLKHLTVQVLRSDPHPHHSIFIPYYHQLVRETAHIYSKGQLQFLLDSCLHQKPSKDFITRHINKLRS